MYSTHKYPVIFTLALVIVQACASYTDQTSEVRSAFRSKNFSSALSKIDDSVIKEQSRNELLYLIEKAMILDRSGELEKSRQLFTRADAVVDKLYTVSVSKTAASFVTNDSMTDYAGEDHEKVAIHTMLGLSYIEQQKWNEAGVEARKINSRLDEINGKYDKSSKNRYIEDGFARYFAGMIHLRNDNWDSAIVDYRKALDIYEGSYSRLFNIDVPDSLVADLARLYELRNRQDDARTLRKKYGDAIDRGNRNLSSAVRGQAEIIVIHELDQATAKKANEFVFMVGSQVVRTSFPSIPQKGRYPGMTGIKVDGEFIAADLVQDMDSIARVTLEDRRGRMVLKQGARLLAKGQIAEQARQNGGPLAGLAVNLFNVATETADTRSWTLLPRLFMVSRKSVKPGAHEIEIKNQGRIAEIKKTKLKVGEIVIFRTKD